MLDEYFNVKKKEENKNLFNGLKIENASKEVKAAQGKYPVINLNLKGIKDEIWEKEYNMIKNILSMLYKENHEVVLVLDEDEKKEYISVENKSAEEDTYVLSLKKLSMYLMRYYKEPVIILIDEYDVSIETGFLKGFYDNAIGFMKNFFGEALKTNNALKFACMTGILKVSKESIFSGLNNLEIYSILDEKYSEYFGFLSNEVSY